MAISAVARPYCTKGSIFLTSFGAILSVGSKPFTAPEMRVAKADASQCVIGPIPERPLTMPSQLAARPLPTGDRLPSPVMTMRRLDIADSGEDSIALRGPRRGGCAPETHAAAIDRKGVVKGKGGTGRVDLGGL